MEGISNHCCGSLLFKKLCYNSPEINLPCSYKTSFLSYSKRPFSYDKKAFFNRTMEYLFVRGVVGASGVVLAAGPCLGVFKVV